MNSPFEVCPAVSHDAAHQGFGHAFECATVELGGAQFGAALLVLWSWCLVS